MITETIALQKNTALVETTLQNDLLVYNPVLRTAYVLNQSGRQIWNLLGNNSDKNLIIELFTNKYGNQVKSDLENFLMEIEKSGLVFSSEGTSENVAAIELGSEYIAPKAEAYSEEFLRKHLNDEAFATFHDDTYSDIATTTRN